MWLHNLKWKLKFVRFSYIITSTVFLVLPMSKKSEVWKSFRKNDKIIGEATCGKCNSNIGWKSSTTAMINHLKLRHNILISKSGLSENYGENNIPKKK